MRKVKEKFKYKQLMPGILKINILLWSFLITTKSKTKFSEENEE